jgi:hypothetical protein
LNFTLGHKPVDRITFNETGFYLIEIVNLDESATQFEALVGSDRHCFGKFTGCNNTATASPNSASSSSQIRALGFMAPRSLGA